jgi:tetratricopeptide (TPR) repeat protein
MLMAPTTDETLRALEKRLKKQPRSPLFARLASLYLEQGRAEEALRVCTSGLIHHPRYTTGRLIKGKALLALQNVAEAHQEFTRVLDLLPGIESVAKLVAETAGAAVSEAPSVEQPHEEPTATTTVKRVGAKAKSETVEQPMPVIEETPPVAAVEETPAAVPMEEEAAATEFPSATEEISTPAPAIAEEETFEQFEARMRRELAGTENTLTLEDYLSGNISSSTPNTTAPNSIEDLAQKLQGAKITPVIDLSSRTPGESDGTSGGFVTPTLAEIYVKQGWYDDAIRAYRTLITTKPEEKDRYEQRIAEIEEMKKSSP